MRRSIPCHWHGVPQPIILNAEALGVRVNDKFLTENKWKFLV